MKDNELFDGMTLKGLFKDIYDNQTSKKIEIGELVKTLATLIRTPEDVAVVGPVLQQFVDTSVKNDEQLVKMANIVQRIIATEMRSDVTSDGMLLSETEKAQLIKNALEDLEDASIDVENTLNDAKDKLNNK